MEYLTEYKSEALQPILYIFAVISDVFSEGGRVVLTCVFVSVLLCGKCL